VRTALRIGAMGGVLAALIDWVGYLVAVEMHLSNALPVTTVAFLLVLLVFFVVGFAVRHGHRPIALGGYAGGLAGLVEGLLTAILPAVHGRGSLGGHVVSYVVLVLDAVVFGVLVGLLGALAMRLREGA